MEERQYLYFNIITETVSFYTAIVVLMMSRLEMVVQPSPGPPTRVNLGWLMTKNKHSLHSLHFLAALSPVIWTERKMGKSLFKIDRSIFNLKTDKISLFS